MSPHPQARAERGAARPGLLGVLLAATVALALAPVSVAGEAEEDAGPPPDDQAVVELPVEAANPGAPVAIRGPVLPERAASGKGRLSVALSGNRRWCTYQDDRVVRPPAKIAQLTAPKKPVYTFGYQFTIAAVERSAPNATLMLYESPVIRTASLRTAVKLGRGSIPGSSPNPVDIDQGATGVVRSPELPTSLVPYWREGNRCASLPERLEIDLDPGTYDVSMAFDLMMRSGNWTHRSVGYLEEVSVEAGRRTRLDGVIDMGAGIRREVRFVGFAIEPEHTPGAGVP